ncbi:twinkle homolog protein, chloroplastic/mitochondrial-like [Salvia splendens]|uniref:twinkle homolog protein, chloroplastic/mitochondrial-like n=1 Tax=Salvia splendens TaxID=180675 RepID=UPI001C26973C|nr:twinkle homolog protein, chloroplastic/mitochondrial-like [Salvia splendens]
MFFLPPRKFLLSPSSKSSRVIAMGSKNFLLQKSPAAPATYACLHSLHDSSNSSPRTLLFDSYSRKCSRLFAIPKQLQLNYLRANGYSYTPYAAMPIPRPISDVNVETLEKQFVDEKKLVMLKQKLQEIWWPSLLRVKWTSLLWKKRASRIVNCPQKKRTRSINIYGTAKNILKRASRIILATDGDPPGQALAEELALLLGRERCWRIKWPKKNDTEYFKDANEVLMYMGPDALKDVIENAELYPIRGLFNFRDYFDEINDYYNQSLGFELGFSTGWKALNELYNVVPGELTIVTGVPNSGKSEWIDALLCNLNHSVGWKFALCSMENQVREHGRKLLEKHIKKPFFDVRYGEHVERMSTEELERGKKWLRDSFSLIRCENDSLPSIRWVLELAKIAVLRYGVSGLVIDPYNELDHQRPPNQTETEYVSQMLTTVKRFAQHHSCHVWFVAHPRQLHNWIGGPANMHDISGSAHFINKCDNGIVIHRNRDPDAGPMDLVQVCVRKVRNKVIGTIGDTYLSYNRYKPSLLSGEKRLS